MLKEKLRNNEDLVTIRVLNSSLLNDKCCTENYSGTNWSCDYYEFFRLNLQVKFNKSSAYVGSYEVWNTDGADLKFSDALRFLEKFSPFALHLNTGWLIVALSVHSMKMLYNTRAFFSSPLATLVQFAEPVNSSSQGCITKSIVFRKNSRFEVIFRRSYKCTYCWRSIDVINLHLAFACSPPRFAG